MTTPNQIAELRRLLADASPGPWGEFRADENDGVEDEEFFICSSTKGVAEECIEADAALIAALRNVAPGLLDDLDALRRENAELREEGAAARSALLQQAEELGRRIADLEAVLFQNPVMEDILWGEQPDSESMTISLKLGKWRRLRAARLVAKPAPETREA